MSNTIKYLDEYFITAVKIMSNIIPKIAATFLYKLYKNHADKLIKSGALKQTAYLQDIFVLTDGKMISQEIFLINGVTCYLTKTGWKEVTEFELRMYTSCFDWLLKTILYGLGASVEHKYHCLLDQFIWNFGNVYLKQYKIPILLVRCITTKEVYSALVQYLNKHHTVTAALLLCIEHDLPEYFALPSNNVCLEIQEILINDLGKVYFNIDLILEKMNKAIQQEGFSNSYRSGYFKGKFYTFSKKQAEAIELMDKASKPLHQDEVMATITPNSSYNRLSAIFRAKDGLHPAWGILVKTDSKGYYWLDY